MPAGDVQNLYTIDFTGDVAVACGPGGELFFAAVFDGAIPDITYQSEGKTIVIGHVASEDEREIRFDRAIKITPQQMRQAHQATNYSPLDCCRGLLNDLRKLQPGSLEPVVVPKSNVRQRMELSN